MFVEDEFFKKILDNLSDGVYLVDQNRQITYWNKAAENITGYSKEELVGTHCFHNLLRHVTEVGEKMCDHHCPLSQTIADGHAREVKMFLHHKKGHRIPVNVHVSPIKDQDGNIDGAVEIFCSDSTAALGLDAIEDLKKLALIDPLTGVGNRRFCDMTLQTKTDELQRYGLGFGVLFIDLDKFKRINDNFGHDVGDEVLKMVTRTLSANLRVHDSICRWGGEEFVAVIAHVSDDKQLRSSAKKLLALLENSSISAGDETIHVTVSIGGAMARPGETPDEVIRRADQLMYKSKEKGGNAMTFDSDE